MLLSVCQVRGFGSHVTSLLRLHHASGGVGQLFTLEQCLRGTLYAVTSNKLLYLLPVFVKGCRSQRLDTGMMLQGSLMVR